MVQLIYNLASMSHVRTLDGGEGLFWQTYFIIISEEKKENQVQARPTAAAAAAAAKLAYLIQCTAKL